MILVSRATTSPLPLELVRRQRNLAEPVCEYASVI
jgi:hypothetical protein